MKKLVISSIVVNQTWVRMVFCRYRRSFIVINLFIYIYHPKNVSRFECMEVISVFPSGDYEKWANSLNGHALSCSFWHKMLDFVSKQYLVHDTLFFYLCYLIWLIKIVQFIDLIWNIDDSLLLSRNFLWANSKWCPWHLYFL